MKACLLLIAAVSAAAAPSTSLQFVPGNGLNLIAGGAVPLASGSVAVFGSYYIPDCVNCLQDTPPLLSILNSSGQQTASLGNSALGGGNSVITGAAADSSGNIWIVGSTTSDNFPLVKPLFTVKAPYQTGGFIAKLDPNLNILFSTFLATAITPPPTNPFYSLVIGTFPNAIALDASGNAYVTGSSADPSFPVTMSFGPAATQLLPQAFVLKLSSDGSKLLYSDLLSATGSPCVGGSSCLGKVAVTGASAIAVGSDGEVTIGGSTYSTNFPVTPNVYTTGGGAFISRISGDGSSLIWSAVIGNSQTIGLGFEPSTVQSLALDAAGNVCIAGMTPAGGGPIVTTPGALGFSSQAGVGRPGGGFVMKLSSDATQLLFAANLTGMNGSTLAGLALDSADNIWVAGFTRSPDFPGLYGVTSVGLDFVGELNGNASAWQQIIQLVPQTVSAPPSFDSNGNLPLLDSDGNLLRLNTTTAFSAPAVFAIANAAVPAEAVTVYAGEIMSLYGVGLGPAAGIVAGPDANGSYPTQLGGVSIQFSDSNGTVQAPLLYVGSNQINFEVPRGVLPASSPVTMTVATPTGDLAPTYIGAAQSIGLFGVINGDGTVNSAANPAPEGSVVSLYLTGLGLPDGSGPDGQIAAAANNAFIDWTEAIAGFTPLPVFYAGTAPGEIDGLDQINVQLPPGVKNPSLGVEFIKPAANTLSSQNAVTVYTK